MYSVLNSFDKVNDTLIEQTNQCILLKYWGWCMNLLMFHILRRFGFTYRYFDKENGKCKADFKQ